MNRTVHYRSVDPIQNLKIRIRLTCRSGVNTDQYHVLPEEPQAEGEVPDQQEKKKGPGFLKRFGLRKEEEKIEDGEAEQDKKAEDEERGGENREDEADEPEVGEEGEKKPPPPESLQSWTRDIGWQEKVFSSHEVQKALSGVEPLGLPSARQLRSIPASPVKQKQLRHLAQASLQEQYRRVIDSNPRYSSAAFSENRIFTYTNADEFSEMNESDRVITTSTTENLNPLVLAMYTRPQHRNEVMKYQTMFIMADCGEKAGTSERIEHELVVIKSFPDGSFDMRPGFSRKDANGEFIDDPYEYEDENGTQWQYTVENAAKTDVTAEEKRREQLMKQHNERARMLRNANTNTAFQPTPGPSPDAMRFVLLAEIMAARDFARDQLWVEYELRYDPEVWLVNAATHEPGVIQGVTQVSHCTAYPGNPGLGELSYYVAHFAHPIELEFMAQADPRPNQWPVIYFQINTYDSWDRYTVQGYTWMSLHSISRGGCAVHRLRTWKPLGTVQDRLHSFFVSGSAELKDMTYTGLPQDFKGRFLSKFGFKAETSGILKVRTMAVIQQRRQVPEEAPKSPTKPRASRVGLEVSRKKEMMNLARVVARARRRLEAARGGPVVVRGEALEVMAEPPVLIKDLEPEVEEVEEGGLAGFSLKAKGKPPLRYTWYFGKSRLDMDNAEHTLLLRDLQMSDAGTYSCTVANADGKVTTRSVELIVVPSLGFAEQPDDFMERVEGMDVEISVQGKGKPPLTYQWYKDNGKLDFDGTCQSPALKLADIATSDAGLYVCEISNEGGQVERSEVCRLIVRPDEDGKLKAAKEKRAAETPKEAEKETEKNEEATMEGDEGEGEEAAGSVVEHEVDEEEQAQVGAFSGDEGDDDEEEEPVIDDEPRGVAVRQGESAKFRVEAHGLKPLAYQWYVDNRVLDGETKPELLVRRAEPRHAGRYTCKVSNPRGEVTTIPARLEVETAAAGGAQEAEDLGDEVEEFSAD